MTISWKFELEWWILREKCKFLEDLKYFIVHHLDWLYNMVQEFHEFQRIIVKYLSSKWRILNDLAGRIGEIFHQTRPMNPIFSSCSYNCSSLYSYLIRTMSLLSPSITLFFLSLHDFYYINSSMVLKLLKIVVSSYIIAGMWCRLTYNFMPQLLIVLRVKTDKYWGPWHIWVQST